MSNTHKPALKAWYIIGSIISSFAVGLQFWVTFGITKTGTATTIINLLSYFTILTNILVALYSLVLWLRPYSRLGRFFSKASTSTAILVYILVVGIIYNLALRHIWSPQGWARLADELLHSVIPLGFLLYWFMALPKTRLSYYNAIPWLIYPGLYIIYTFIRGLWMGTYPYPFIDVHLLGYPTVLKNCAVIALSFYALSLLFIATGNKLTNKTA
jgi:hypothetical protein